MDGYVCDAEYPHLVTQKQIDRCKKFVRAISNYFQTDYSEIAKDDILLFNDRKILVLLVDKQEDNLYTIYFMFAEKE